jgi:hypothetical protein
MRRQQKLGVLKRHCAPPELAMYFRKGSCGTGIFDYEEVTQHEGCRVTLAIDRSSSRQGEDREASINHDEAHAHDLSLLRKDHSLQQSLVAPKVNDPSVGICSVARTHEDHSTNLDTTIEEFSI